MSGNFVLAGWLVQPSLNRLTRGTETVRLEPKVMHVLVCLARAAGEVVTREQLLAEVWPDVHVTDDVLHRAVRELRRAFADSATEARCIETIRKRGYRLLVPVSADAGAVAPSAAVVSAAARADRQLLPRWFALRPSLLWFALAAGSIGGLAALMPRSDAVTEAHGRFVPLVNGPENESDPAIAPDGRQLAFVVRTGEGPGQGDLFVRALPWGETRRLTSAAADERMPAWAPDGRTLAFVRTTADRCDLVVQDVATSAERIVMPCGNRDEPRVSWLDGSALVLSVQPPTGRGGWRLARMPLGSEGRSFLTDVPAGIVGDHSPAVSPDGRAIAFVRHVSGGVSDVHVVPVNGGRARRLTFDEADLTGVAWLSPSSLVYSSDRAGGYSLWRVNVNGGEPQLVAGGAARLKHPVAAGHRVVYESWQYEINIWRQPLPPLAGRNAAAASLAPVPIIRTSDLWNLSPQLSPDGSALAYVSTQSGTHEVWIASADGTGARQVTRFGDEPGAEARGTTVRAPRWAFDGKRLVASAHWGGRSDVVVIDVAEGAVSRLTNDDAIESAPSWSADGTRVLYGRRDGVRSDVWEHPLDGTPPRLLIADAFAAQSDGDGRVYFTRADRAGLWRMGGEPGAAVLVSDAVGAGDWANWQVADRGVFFAARDGDAVVLRRATDGGAAATIAALPNFSWPGFSVAADGGGVLYAKWDRRESNLLSIELTGTP